MSKVLVDQELLPCPFCGQQEAFVEQLDSDASVVICQGMVDEHSACLARGPVGVQQSEMEDQPGRGAAIAEWNRRAQPAEAEGVEVIAYATPNEDGDWQMLFFGEKEAMLYTDDGQPAPLVLRSARLAALSAVTAERDRLLAELERAYANYNQVSYASTERGKQIDQLRAEVERYVPLHEAVQRAARELPEGWAIQLYIERDGGGVELIGPAGTEDFATNNERLDYTVIDALEAAMAAKEG